METTAKKLRGGENWLYDISFIRPILLIMLVSYHAFCYNCGAWNAPESITTNEIYKWLANLSRSFRLEGFVFISGYIFALQVFKKNKFNSITQLATSKFKRLIIPSILFSVLYFYLFFANKGVAFPTIDIISGFAHMWYLPCLFWCFIGTYIIYKSNLKESLVALLLLLLIPLSIAPLPLQLSSAMYYMFFFWAGGYIWKHSEQIKEWITGRRILCAWITFVVLVVAVNLLIEHLATLPGEGDRILKAITLGSSKALKATLAVSGIFALYISALRYTANHSLKSWVVGIGDYGYSVYIIHQFVLIYLYYNTSLPQAVGSTWLPWVGFLITATSSLLIAWALRKTRVGRALL